MTIKKSARPNKKVAEIKDNIILHDNTTGELKEYRHNVLYMRDQAPNRNFGMLFFDTLNFKIYFDTTQFLFWLLSVSARNRVMMKAEDIAKKFDTTRPRIDRMKRRLKKQGFIKYIPNVIFINPNFYWRGSASMRENAAQEYLNF